VDLIPKPEEVFDLHRLASDQEQGLTIIGIALMWVARDEEWMRKVAIWLEEEARSRLAVYVKRIAKMARNRAAFNLKRLLAERRRLAEELVMKAAQAKRIQVQVRMRQARRRVADIALKFFTKFVPTDAPPYWLNPATRVQVFIKPALFLGGDCMPVRVPPPGMSCVVGCVNCSDSAVSNCVQCDESMCRTCFDAMHCKGERRKHRRDKIPLCSYCKYQVAHIHSLSFGPDPHPLLPCSYVYMPLSSSPSSPP
jgi:hypothetical protein